MEGLIYSLFKHLVLKHTYKIQAINKKKKIKLTSGEQTSMEEL